MIKYKVLDFPRAYILQYEFRNQVSEFVITFVDSEAPFN
jgi:hypothetical protein